MVTIKEIQTQLKALGFYTGAIDGIKGAYTIKAIKAFQKSKGLLQDGIVGSVTLKALGLSVVTPISSGTKVAIQSRIEKGTLRPFNNFTEFYNLVKTYCDYAYYFNGQYNATSAIDMVINDINGAAKGLNCVDYTQVGVRLAREMGYTAVPYGIWCSGDQINHAIFTIQGKEFTNATWIDLAAAASNSKSIGLHWCTGSITKEPSWIPYE